jgi:hypothetical protein
MARNKVFTARDIEAIVTIIRDWPKETISWDDVRKASVKVLGYEPSRQGLNQREEILRAFQAKKGHLRVQPKEASPMPSSLAVAARRISRLVAENRELELQNKRLMEKFRTWQYNASAKNMTEKDLDKPLPILDKYVASSEKDEYGRVK